jgi:deoxyribodipyrimidine photolyase
VKTSLVLFTRDLRVHDHPALTAAAGSADQVVPLFLLDDALLVLNPDRQARRFDPDGEYVRRYVPEPAEAGVSSGGGSSPNAISAITGVTAAPSNTPKIAL